LFLEFQKYVVNTLSTIKYDLNCCVSTNQQINANMNTLLENLNKNTQTSDDGFNDYDLNDIFPIESLEALQEFEFKLQQNENNFKTIIVMTHFMNTFKMYTSSTKYELKK